MHVQLTEKNTIKAIQLATALNISAGALVNMLVDAVEDEELLKKVTTAARESIKLESIKTVELQPKKKIRIKHRKKWTSI